MEIAIDSAGRAELRQPDEFTRFAVVLHGVAQDAAALGALGVVDGEHVFVDPGWVTDRAGTDPAWRTKFDGMVAYAASKGRIRAHVEVADG